MTELPASLAPGPPSTPANDVPPIVELSPTRPCPDPAADLFVPTLPPVPKVDQRATAASALMATATAIAEMQGLQVYPQTQKRSRAGLQVALAVLLLAALVVAGIVFGRPYLFPHDWDAASEPYARAVEAGGDITFGDPLSVTAVTPREVADRVVAELVESWEDVQPMWRSFGLTTGASTRQAVADQLTGWQDVVYSSAEGQVFYDSVDDAAQRDAEITQAMVAAALDQEFGWSTAQASRSLDERSAVTAEVTRQARQLQSASTYGAAVAPVDPSALDGVPSVIAYSALAPHVFAEFESAGDESENPLGDLDGVAQVLPDDEVGLASPAVMNAGDVAVSAPVAMDRSFWYLAFAGRIDSRTAYVASESVVENAVTMAERGSSRCAYATFSGSGVAATASLRGALEQWAAAAPAEFGATFTVLADGTLQLVSCDPGPQFSAPMNPSAHRSLLAWRVAELATIESVVAGGSTDLENDIFWTWAVVAGTRLADDLAALPATTPPADLVAAARAGVAAVTAAQAPPESALLPQP